MLNENLITKAQEVLEKATESAEEYTGLFGTIQQFIVENFGETGLYAAYISSAALILLIVWKLTKVSFGTLKYMVIPAIGLAFIGSFFLPYSFLALLPVTVTGCSLLLLFKG